MGSKRIEVFEKIEVKGKKEICDFCYLSGRLYVVSRNNGDIAVVSLLESKKHKKEKKNRDASKSKDKKSKKKKKGKDN